MKSFIDKLQKKYEVLEKHFDADQKVNHSMNKFLYEYEVNSVLAYSMETNEKLT